MGVHRIREAYFEEASEELELFPLYSPLPVCWHITGQSSVT